MEEIARGNRVRRTGPEEVNERRDDGHPSAAVAPAGASGSWRPLLSGSEAGKAITIAEEIAAVIGPSAPEGGAALAPEAPDAGADSMRATRSFSLSGGDAGIAVFLSYLEAARPGRGYGDWARSHLERAIDGMAVFDTQPLLYTGFPGVAWAVEHLNGRLFEDDGDDPGEEVARMLVEHLGISPWRGRFELIAGIAGLGVYALERLPRPHGEECLRRAVARLAEIAELRPEGVTWFTPREWLPVIECERHPAGNYNLGVSHGVPGVIGFLGEAVKARELPEARALLAGAVAWLLGQKLPPGQASIFAESVAPGSAPAPTRISWCYGDLGIATMLLGTARRAGEPAWEAEALALARRAAGRPLDLAGVIDPSLCHGAAGAAHLFNRLHQATGEPLFEAVARRWIERLYALRDSDRGLAGFSTWLPDAKGNLTWRDDPGLLTGVAGVGLALLAAATAVEPAWDRLLLASVPG